MKDVIQFNRYRTQKTFIHKKNYTQAFSHQHITTFQIFDR